MNNEVRSEVVMGLIINESSVLLIKPDGSHTNTPALFRLHKHLGAERKDVSPHPAS